MEKEQWKKEIQNSINEEEAIAFLQSLIRVPSENLAPTYAQELVKNKLRSLGFTLDSFPCETDSIKDLSDFCNFEGNDQYDPLIENVVGIRKGTEQEGHSFLLHAHIDSANRSDVMPDFSCRREDGKIYGLGAADDKGGVAIMLMAAEAVLQNCPELKKDLILMSTIGKRGAVGTLSAFRRGYHADAAIYLHPAETGHGFLEIKNYSMGNVDFDVTVSGKPGVFRDEIDDSEVSAVKKGAKIIKILSDWEKKRRAEHHFKEDTFAGLPNTKLNFLGAESKDLLREDVLTFVIHARLCFGLEETVADIMEEVKEYVHQQCLDDSWLSLHPPTFTFGTIKADPAYVSRSSELIKSTEKNIGAVKQFTKEFIYQYHANSDIRMPIRYGHTPTVGIGPLCGGLNGDGEEWISEADYLAGIRIAVGMIIDWCL